jgi:D-galactarolactone cycloisomerase
VKIETIEAIPVLAAPMAGQTYWGARAWSSDLGADIDNYPVAVRRRFAYSATIDTVLVKVATEDGTIGWDECKAPVAAPVTAALVNSLLAPLVVGTSLDEIAVTWEGMYAAMRVRGHDSGFWLEAISGVDIALWDAWARYLNQPITALLGGVFRRDVPIYASGIPAIPGPEGLRSVREQAQQLVERGYTAIKVAIGLQPESDLAAVREVKDILGPSGRVFVDAAGQYDVAQALRVGRALSDLEVGFFEMPIPPEDIHGYASLAAKLDTPLALDSITTRHRALEYLRLGALHVLQPDVCRAGGISEVMRIAALADAFGAIATPHVSIGSAIHFAASLQCGAAIPNLDILEQWIGANPLGTAIAADLDEPESSRRTVPKGPGLGIQIDEHAVRKLGALRD